MDSSNNISVETITEDKKYINLTPTHALLDNVNWLQNANIEPKQVVVGIGDGTQASASEPSHLEHELEQINVTKIDSLDDKKRYEFQVSVPSEYKERVHEFGLYFKDPEGKLDLIAYCSSQDLSVMNLESLILSLELPRAQEATALEIENYPVVMPDSPVEIEENQAEDKLTPVLAEEAIWHMEGEIQKKINPNDTTYIFEAVNLIGISYNKDNTIHLLYKGKACGCIFIGQYDIKQQALSPLVYSITIDEDFENKDAIFARITDKQITCFLLNKIGVFSLKIDLLNNFQGSYQQFYSVPCPLNNTSLANIADYPYLLGGNIGRDLSGCAGSIKSEVTSYAPYPRQQLSYARDNPLIEYFQNKIIVIGGNRDVTQPCIEMREATLPKKEYFYETGDLILTSPSFPILRCSEKNNYQACLSAVNSLTHVHCRVEGKIFIFPINLFLEEAIQFYIYDLINLTFYSKELPVDFLEKLKFESLSYDTCKVVTVNKKIYFFLTQTTNKSFRQKTLVFNCEKENLV